jgi:hypothetical protein
MNATDVVLRSSAILAVGLVAHGLLSRRSAALRHFVLAATIFMSAAIVPLSLTVPSWDIRLPAWSHEQAEVSSVITVAATRSAAQAPSSSTGLDVARLAIGGWTPKPR